MKGVDDDVQGFGDDGRVSNQTDGPPGAQELSAEFGGGITYSAYPQILKEIRIDTTNGFIKRVALRHQFANLTTVEFDLAIAQGLNPNPGLMV